MGSISLQFGANICEDVIQQIRPGETSYVEAVRMLGDPVTRTNLPDGGSLIRWTACTEFFDFAPDHQHVLDIQFDVAGIVAI